MENLLEMFPEEEALLGLKRNLKQWKPNNDWKECQM